MPSYIDLYPLMLDNSFLMMLDYLTMTDAAILNELGSRLESLRLNINITQRELSNSSGLSIDVIRELERGKGKLQSLIVFLRELQALDELDNFIPPMGPDPVSIARMQGKVRQRARSKKNA